MALKLISANKKCLPFREFLKNELCEFFLIGGVPPFRATAN